jgi:hypothetical protein
MPNEKLPAGLHPSLISRPFPGGDPFVLLDVILQEADESKRAQIIGLSLDAMAATLQANLKLVEGIRKLVGAGK